MKQLGYLLLILFAFPSCKNNSMPTTAQNNNTTPVSGYWLTESSYLNRGVTYMIFVDTVTKHHNDGSSYVSTYVDSVVLASFDTVTHDLKSVLNIGRASSGAANLIYFPAVRDTLNASFEFTVAGDSDIHKVFMYGSITDSSFKGFINFWRVQPSSSFIESSLKDTTVAVLAKAIDVAALNAIRVGNGNSHVFHTVECYYTPGLVNPVYFRSRDEAILAGYTPDGSGKCNP